MAVLRISTFERLAEPDSPLAWDRPSYLHATVLVDRLGGRVEALVDALRTLGPAEARGVAAAQLDNYVNSYFRALKSASIGLAVESHLDAAESIPPLLAALFALHGRVRPFNRDRRATCFRGWRGSSRRVTSSCRQRCSATSRRSRAGAGSAT